MPRLRIDQARADGRTTVLILTGALDLATADELPVAVRAALDERPHRIVLDCRECPFVDTAGLAAMVGALRVARQVGVAVQVAGVNERLRLLLERTNLFRVLREVSVPVPSEWNAAAGTLPARSS